MNDKPTNLVADEPTVDSQRALELEMRRARLLEVDALERKLGISPRTAELRRDAKEKEKKTT